MKDETRKPTAFILHRSAFILDFHGAEQARTANPRVANAVLSQLSYGPDRNRPRIVRPHLAAVTSAEEAKQAAGLRVRMAISYRGKGAHAWPSHGADVRSAAKSEKPAATAASAKRSSAGDHLLAARDLATRRSSPGRERRAVSLSLSPFHRRPHATALSSPPFLEALLKLDHVPLRRPTTRRNRPQRFAHLRGNRPDLLDASRWSGR